MACRGGILALDETSLATLLAATGDDGAVVEALQVHIDPPPPPTYSKIANTITRGGAPAGRSTIAALNRNRRYMCPHGYQSIHPSSGGLRRYGGSS